MSDFIQIHVVGGELFHADGRTDMTKLIVAIRNLRTRLKIFGGAEGRHLLTPPPTHTQVPPMPCAFYRFIARAEPDGTRAETRFRLSPKRTSPFKSVGASVQSTAGSRGVRISLSNAG